SPDRYYTGVTSDIRARLDDHNAGRCAHTADGRPWQVDVVVQFADEPRALKFERYLKLPLRSHDSAAVRFQEPIEHPNGGNGVVPIDDEGAPAVDPARAEQDREGQARDDALLARGDIQDRDGICASAPEQRRRSWRR